MGARRADQSDDGNADNKRNTGVPSNQGDDGESRRTSSHVRFTEQARRGYEARDFEVAFDGTTKAQAILMELINALRPAQAPELCERLTALYTYIYKQLVQASSTRELAPLDEVLKLLRFERETWSMCIDELSRENRDASRMQELPSGVAPTAAQVREAKPRVSITG